MHGNFFTQKKRLGRHLTIFATTIRTNISPTHDVSPKACRLRTTHHNPFLYEIRFPNKSLFLNMNRYFLACWYAFWIQTPKMDVLRTPSQRTRNVHWTYTERTAEVRRAPRRTLNVLWTYPERTLNERRTILDKNHQISTLSSPATKKNYRHPSTKKILPWHQMTPEKTRTGENHEKSTFWPVRWPQKKHGVAFFPKIDFFQNQKKTSNCGGKIGF